MYDIIMDIFIKHTVSMRFADILTKSLVNYQQDLEYAFKIDCSPEDIKQDVFVNYIGSINVVKASIPYLQKTHGSILLFTSSSYTRGRALYSTYSSAKAGIVNLTQALAEELMSEKININVINPERTATPMRLKAFGKEPEGSLLNPEKVADISLKRAIISLLNKKHF